MTDAMSVKFVTRSRLKLVRAEVLAKVEALEKDARQQVAAKAQELAPVGDPAVDPHSGELRAGIGVDGNKVVSTAPHSKFVEYGTVHMEAQPFMAPAVRFGRDIMRAGLAAIRRGL